MSVRIGVYGGLFDPPHYGHREAALSFLDSGYLDRLLIVPTAWPPHKASKPADFTHRMAMCGFAFADLHQTDIMDLESELPAPSYTIHTLETLRNRIPDADWSICIGADQLESFHRWYRSTDILSIADLLVVERIGHPAVVPPTLDRFADSVTFVRHRPTSQSSSALRAGRMMEDVPEKVRRYIRLNRLYG